MLKNESYSIELTRDQYLELEKISLGAFFPLTGFMDEREFNSVVNNLRLPSGEVFSLPVILDIDEDVARLVKNLHVVDLTFSNIVVGLIYPSDFFSCNRPEVAKKIYGTDDLLHPGVSNFYDLKPVFIGGKVELIERARFDISDEELTPDQTKQIFVSRGWKKIVGFQTRNVPHRAHEYLLRLALEYSDGLFIQPLVGRKRLGDFTPEAILRGYRALIGNVLPEQNIVLGVLSTQMRYAGPREAVFHAIIRRNYGCTHFIVGRDHAGVGDWYGLYDAHELTRSFDGELGIEIMRLKGPFYCRACDGISTERTCAHEALGNIEEISGTYMRNILCGGSRPAPYLMRQVVIDSLDGIDCFIE